MAILQAFWGLFNNFTATSDKLLFPSTGEATPNETTSIFEGLGQSLIASTGASGILVLIVSLVLIILHIYTIYLLWRMKGKSEAKFRSTDLRSMGDSESHQNRAVATNFTLQESEADQLSQQQHPPITPPTQHSQQLSDSPPTTPSTDQNSP